MEIKTYWIIKSALSKGVYSVQGRRGEYGLLIVNRGRGRMQRFRPGEWCETQEEALWLAERMRNQAIIKHVAAIERLGGLHFYKKKTYSEEKAASVQQAVAIAVQSLLQFQKATEDDSGILMCATQRCYISRALKELRSAVRVLNEYSREDENHLLYPPADGSNNGS